MLEVWDWRMCRKHHKNLCKMPGPCSPCNWKGKAADTLLISVEYFLTRLIMLINIHSSWLYCPKYYVNVMQCTTCFSKDFWIFYLWKYHNTNKSQEIPLFPLFPLSFLGIFLFSFYIPTSMITGPIVLAVACILDEGQDSMALRNCQRVCRKIKFVLSGQDKNQQDTWGDVNLSD